MMKLIVDQRTTKHQKNPPVVVVSLFRVGPMVLSECELPRQQPAKASASLKYDQSRVLPFAATATHC
jgi:hypothetical protein